MIVVTAPTSNIGHRVVERLLDNSQPIRVIARDPSRLSQRVREGAEVFEGSHADPEVINRALDGADAVFWLVPADSRATSVTAAYVDFSRPAVQAFAAKGVKRVVGITALGRGTPQAGNAGFVTGSLAMDDLIIKTGVSFVEIANPSFMDNIARQAEPLRSKGLFFGPIDGDRRMPTCATRDIAAVSARWLLDDSWSGSQRAAVLGPEDLSFNDMAVIMTDVLGKPIRYQQTSFDQYKTGFLDRGMSSAMAQGMTDMAVAKNDGLDNAEPRTAENTTPTTFRQWCEEELKPALAD